MAHVVITGANRGIGLELARLFSQRGDKVTAICRRASDELQQLNVTVLTDIDISQDACVEQIRQALTGQTVDILINNAGLLHHETLPSPNWDTMRAQFEINTLGPLRVTSALLENLHKGGKVGLITSRMGSVEDNSSGAYYGYRMSKAGLNAIGKSLALDLKSRGVAVALLHPGYVITDMTGHSGDITPDVAAKGLAARIDELTLENSGKFWHANGELLPW
ncbi:short-chain alcohol dehydrogenase-like protein [Hahella chejuensis KCTC 2396]|uniref:Short-chain alcohol dehydrogenase-like protein n=1 Tax=Hahella chejuensis (strain KCTC 2396) TaxID=349521 RepID=Q2SCA7_HAHCH|nr:SDR family oxidoreductase [Hahella chejuensis]ABC31717.1 short-chain alcohol dehydrogenase-like protein [Hahella chejuensis KCTC 2396]